MSDDALYRQYLAGDLSAGDQLMLRYGDALTAYLDAFLHNAHDAEDLMLDCFTVILVKKPGISEGRFRAYLFKMARYKAIRLNRLRFRQREFNLDVNLLSRNESPEDAMWRSEQMTALRKCLGRIAPQYREVLWLVYGMEMSYAQAAEVMGCGTGRIHYLLDDGKQRMRREMEKEGITRADI